MCSLDNTQGRMLPKDGSLCARLDGCAHLLLELGFGALGDGGSGLVAGPLDRRGRRETWGGSPKWIRSPVVLFFLVSL